MRPTVLLLSSAAALAVSASVSPASAQDAGARRDREVTVQQLGGLLSARIARGGDEHDRPVLGVSLASSRGRSDTLGIRITDVNPDGPAAKAGVEEGDRITRIDDTSLRLDAADAEDPAFSDLASRRLQRALAKHKPGEEVSLMLARGRESRVVRVKTVAADELTVARGYAMGPGGSYVFGSTSARASADSLRARAERRAALGLTIGATGTRRDTLGLFVSNVAPDGPAERAGLVEGARVASIDGVDLRLSRDDADDPEIASLRARRFSRELEKKKPGDDVALRIWQNGASRVVTVKAGKAADVWKGRSGFAYSFGDGDGLLSVPPLPPMPAMAPMPPARFRTSMPQLWMQTPSAVTIPRVRRVDY